MKTTNARSEAIRRQKEIEAYEEKVQVLSALPKVLNKHIQAKQYSNYVLTSLYELYESGFTRTGISNKSGKIIWTDELCEVLCSMNIFNYEKGNDAPRQGGNGEYVKIPVGEIKDRIDYLTSINEL